MPPLKERLLSPLLCRLWEPAYRGQDYGPSENFVHEGQVAANLRGAAHARTESRPNLRVMSPTSYQTAPPRAVGENGAVRKGEDYGKRRLQYGCSTAGQTQKCLQTRSIPFGSRNRRIEFLHGTRLSACATDSH